MSLECGGFYRTYIGNAYKYPLTMSLIGYQGIPIGVKAVIFDPVECKENGMFFTVNPEAWRKKGNEITKKKSYKYVSVIPLEADFYLHYVLEKVGYKVLLNSIQVEKGNGGCDNLGKCLIKGSLSIVDNIENLINIINVLEVYRNE